jgi:hypothetical protein
MSEWFKGKLRLSIFCHGVGFCPQSVGMSHRVTASPLRLNNSTWFA